MTPECPIHESPASVQFLLTKSGYDLYVCRDCDHIFVAPTPSDDELRALYSFEQGYHSDGDGLQEKTISGVPKRFVDALDVMENAGVRGSILDVGCTTGRFLDTARDRGWTTLGVELNAGTAELARRAGHEVITGTIESVDPTKHQFDAVHMAEVIEHVAEPKKMIARARQLLKPDGALYVTTPNSDAFFARATYPLYRLFGIPWSHVTPPHHLHQFSKRSLSRLLAGCGFGRLSFTYAPPILRYEIGQTEVIPEFRSALAGGISLKLLSSVLRLAITAVTYPPLHAANLLKPGNSQDCSMYCMARPV